MGATCFYCGEKEKKENVNQQKDLIIVESNSSGLQICNECWIEDRCISCQVGRIAENQQKLCQICRDRKQTNKQKRKDPEQQKKEENRKTRN